MADYLASADDFLAISYVDGNPAGFARAHRLRRLDGLRPKLMLYEIGTIPRFQRLGVARALVERMIEIAKSIHASKMFVLTDASNEAAMSLYASTGGTRARSNDVLFEYDTR